MPVLAKMDEFSEKLLGGRGVGGFIYDLKKSIVDFFTHWGLYLTNIDFITFPLKKCNIFSWEKGGVKGRSDFLKKINFCRDKLP